MKRKKIIYIIIIIISLICIITGIIIVQLNNDNEDKEETITYDLKCEKEMYNFIYETTINITANYSTKDDEIIASEITATITQDDDSNNNYLDNLYNEYTKLYENKDNYPIYELALNNTMTIKEKTNYKEVTEIPDQTFRDFVNMPHLDLSQRKKDLIEELTTYKFTCN